MKITVGTLRKLVRETAEDQNTVQISLAELTDIVDDLKQGKFDMAGPTRAAMERLEELVSDAKNKQMGARFPMGKYGVGR